MKRTRRQPQTPSSLPRLSRWFALPMADSPRIESRLRAILANPPRTLTPQTLWRVRVLSGATGLGAACLLAVVRPTLGRAKPPPDTPVVIVKAKAATRSTQQLPADPQRVVQGPDGHYIEAGRLRPLPYNTVPQKPRWTHAFPGGITIDLAGIAEGKSPRGVDTDLEAYKTNWVSWSPDGARLPSLFIDRSPNRFHDGIDMHPPRLLAFAFRQRPGVVKDVDFTFKVDDNAGYVGFSRTLNQTPQDNWREGGFLVLDATQPTARKEATVRVGVATGVYPYHTEMQVYLNQSGTASTGFWAGRAAQAYFGSPIQGKGRLGLVVRDNVKDCQIRFVAIDRAGKRHEPDEIQDNENYLDSNSRIVWFDEKSIPAAQIATLRLEARPYHWETYDHIALYPEKASR